MRPLTAIAAAVAVVGFLVSVYCFSRALGWELALGTYADWVVAVFTLAAVFTALGIAGRDRRLRAIEREDESKTHARLVQIAADCNDWSPTIEIHVVNHGQLPVLDVDLHDARWTEHPGARWVTNWAQLANWRQRAAMGLGEDTPAPPLLKDGLHHEILKPRNDLDDSRRIHEKTVRFSVCFVHADREEPILGSIDPEGNPPPNQSIFAARLKYPQPDMSAISITVRFTTADGIGWQVTTKGGHGEEPERIRS